MPILVGISNYVECLFDMEVGFGYLETLAMALSTIVPLPDRDFLERPVLACLPTCFCLRLSVCYLNVPF